MLSMCRPGPARLLPIAASPGAERQTCSLYNRDFFIIVRTPPARASFFAGVCRGCEQIAEAGEQAPAPDGQTSDAITGRSGNQSIPLQRVRAVFQCTGGAERARSGVPGGEAGHADGRGAAGRAGSDAAPAQRSGIEGAPVPARHTPAMTAVRGRAISWLKGCRLTLSVVL